MVHAFLIRQSFSGNHCESDKPVRVTDNKFHSCSELDPGPNIMLLRTGVDRARDNYLTLIPWKRRPGNRYKKHLRYVEDF